MIAPLLGLLLACAPQRCQAHGTALGTTWQVTWTAERCEPQVGNDAAALIELVESSLSVWSDDSELHALRRTAGPSPVSESTYRLIWTALDVAGASQGAFDPTIEPVMRAWGLRGEGEMSQPDPTALASALAGVGWERLVAERDSEGHPTVDPGGASLDLSGLLEGHAADRLSAQLQRDGLGNHVITVGDEIRVGGTGLAGPWRLALDVEPGEPGSDLVFRLGGGGLASAGRNETTMDPRTGRPVDTDVLRAVVVAPTTTEADALATAWVVLGSERGLALIEARPDVEGLVFTKTSPKPVTSSNMTSMIE